MTCPDVDAATTRFYEELRASPVHGPFIREVESIPTPWGALATGRALIAPAAFYVEYPQFGGDGQLVRRVAGRFGIDAAVIPVPSLGSVTENAEVVATSLQKDVNDLSLLEATQGLLRDNREIVARNRAMHSKAGAAQ